MFFRFLFYKFVSLGLLFNICFAQNYLSNLSAAKGDPLFTTYAAPLQRSEFIIDEGYHFKFYDENDGVNFITDNAGYLSLVFKLDNEIRYRLNQVFSEPVITTSYADLVKYHYQPFSGINVNVFFQVYSSRIAIQNVTITNQRQQPVQVDVYSVLQHPLELKNVNLSPDQHSFFFSHNEPPDGWTLGHGVPYQDERANVYLLSESPDAFGSYRELGQIPPPQPALTPVGENYCVEWGLVYHADSSLCFHVPPDAQQIILHNGSVQEILTEMAPKWGGPDPNIPGNGYQGCELGNFRNPPIAAGDSFTVIFTCLATAQQGTARGVVPALPAPSGVQHNMKLSVDPFPLVPQNVSVQFSLNNESAVVHWDQVPGLAYNVYRRTNSTPGRYDLVAEILNASGYLDLGLNPDSTYGYVVVARDSLGKFSGHSVEVGNVGMRSFFEDAAHLLLSNTLTLAQTKVIAFQKRLSLSAGEAKTFRMVRAVAGENANADSLRSAAENLLSYNMEQAVTDDEALYSRIPRFAIPDADEEMVYWSAFSLIRQCMLPPEGQCSYNYYVFSREPQWGWGHGGQVFHESLTMLAYAFMDPLSAMNSQRVYLERQWADGYINYRTGPYLNETIPYNGQYTTSAPWYNWENWEVFQIHPDSAFLNEAYQSGKLFYQYWLNNRDADNDGLCEWSAHAVLESVRDGKVAVWDQVGWPSDFECLDLNCMLVNEANSLAEMAQTLELNSEARMWRQEAVARSDSINKYMWDAQSGFYYHVDKVDNDFSFHSNDDLKRQEIIGFLPLWAGVADSLQAAQLLQHLTTPGKFWRNYGIPTLAADDPYYNAMGYWNGPVWVQWQYLIFRGLLHYGYVNEAQQLAEKVFENVIHQLKTNHWFWELYSPDDYRAGWHKTYIWSGLVARMLIDLYGPSVGMSEKMLKAVPQKLELRQNYPNPFNSVSIIEFSLPRRAFVSLKIFDVSGRQVNLLLNEWLDPGEHRTKFSASGLASGIYYYQLVAGKAQITRKLLFLK